jgi:hypothetical protein
MDYGTSDPGAGDYGGTEISCPPPSAGGTGALPFESVPWDGEETATPLTTDEWAAYTSEFDFSDGPFVDWLAEHTGRATEDYTYAQARQIYETADPTDEEWAFKYRFPGLTPSESALTKSDSSVGGDKKLDAMSAKMKTYKNPLAGKKISTSTLPLRIDYTDKNGTLYTNKFAPGKIGDLDRYAKLDYFWGTDADGNPVLVSVGVHFNMRTLPPDDVKLTEAIFTVSNGDISQCTGARGVYLCDFYQKAAPRGGSATPPGGAKLLGDDDTSYQRAVPVCAGGVIDTGYGVTTHVSLADANCAFGAGEEPVQLGIEKIYTPDTSGGIPLADYGDGGINFSPTATAAGTYVPLRVWAITADGTQSWPFDITFRVRNAPQVKSAPAIDAVRGVESVVRGSSLFSDVDIDQHAAESGDHLTSQIVSNPTKGAAYFDAAGDLHYVPEGMVDGSYDDQITVKTVDSFGLPSGDLTIPIRVRDVAPDCGPGGSSTDARTPVRIGMICTLSGPAGWWQMPGQTMRYSILSQPAFGTLSDFDPGSGTATYTPDPGHLGPVSFSFQGEYNGQTRSAVYAVNVLAAP